MEVFEQILKVLDSAAGQTMVIGVVLDFVFRLVPSQKPLSLIHVIANVAKKSGEVLSKFGALLDKVLPQKIK